MLAAGCAHQKAYKRADRLSQQGQYERAVEELETAIRLAEESGNDKAADRYRARLDEVKQQAGQFFYRDAEIRFKQADLGAAQGFIERCVKYCPQEQTYWLFRERVLKAIAEAEQMRGDALALAEQRQWREAVLRMNEALAVNRTMPGGQADLKKIQDRAYQYYLDRAQERLRENDLPGAEAQAQTALSYQQNGKEAKGVIQTVADRREAARLIARGRTFLDQGNAEAALDTLEQAHRLHPEHADLPDLLERARRAVCDQWLAQGRRSMEAREYAAALRLFRKSQDLLRGYGGVDALLSEAKSRLAEIHLNASRQFRQSGADGSAVFHATMALGYRPDDIEAQRQLGQSAEAVRQEVGYTIAFAGFRAAPEQQALAAMLGSVALEHLTRARPANVTLVERADLRAILDEQDLTTKGRVALGSRAAPGRLQGVDALIMGQVLDGKVIIESKRTGHGESVYQDGYRPEPNPDHVQAAAELDAAIEQLEAARAHLAQAEARLARYRHIDPVTPDEWARKRRAQADVDEAKQRLVNAAATVGTARLRLGSIPPEVLVPNMVKHQYPIETFTKTARITCMLKMLDTATGEILVAERIEGRHTQSDRVVAADPHRNVPEDALDLPPESVMLDMAANALAEKLKPALTAAALKHGQRFLVAKQQARAAGDVVRAVDASVKYLFAYPAGGQETNAIVDDLHRYLADEDDLLDIRHLLRTYCRVLLN